MQWIIIIAVIISSALGLWLFWSWLIRKCEAAQVADWGNYWFNRLDGLNRIFCRRYHRFVHDDLGLPASGGVLVASNHVSGLDPLLMIAASPRPLRFLIAREEYDRWWLRWLFKGIGCIPVERMTNAKSALSAAKEALESGEVVALFPHGRIALDHELPEAPLKRGIFFLAQLTGVTICPLRIGGIRGQGMKISAVFLRSRAHISVHSRLDCRHLGMEKCFKYLEMFLSSASAQVIGRNTTLN